MSVQGKVAIVTGSSSGIGRAIALALGTAGASVCINYREDARDTEQMKRRIEGAGGQAIVVSADVGKLADVQRLVDETVRAFGRLDVMVNNAGIEPPSPVLETDEATYDKIMDVNLKAAFFGTQFAARRMVKQGGGGVVINISSVHEDWPQPGHTVYCLSKGGMRMLTRNTGVELAKHGIRVVGVGPGAIATRINEEVREDPELEEELNRTIPLGRIGKPEEVAQLVRWLASGEASYLTATTVFVDGGIMQYSSGL